MCEIIVKYRTSRGFTDKNTKAEIKANDLIDVTVERMKELNAANAGRAEDIIVAEKTKEDTIIDPEKDPQELKGEKKTDSGPSVKSTNSHTKEELEALTVNQLKELAEKEKIELTKARKDEIISEILGE